MKRILLLFVFMAALQLTYGQKSIDNLFQKYSDKDGFTSVILSGNLLKMVSDHDNDFPSGIIEMRILTQEDKSIDAGNFYDMVMNDINRKDYEEFMSVKESG
jgi:phage head maturation protease